MLPHRRLLPAATIVMLLYLLLGRVALASTPTEVNIHDGHGVLDMTRYLSYLEDPDGTLKLDDVRSPAMAKGFTTTLKDTPGFGFTPSAYWFRLELVSTSPHTQQRLLEVAYSPLQSIEVTVVHDPADTAPPRVMKGGTEIPAHQRVFLHRNHIFPIEIHANARATVWLRVKTEGSMTVPLRLWIPAHFTEETVQEYLVHGTYFGIMLCLVAYNLFIWSIVREITYLLYALFIFSTVFFFAAIAGHGQAYLWQEAGASSIRLLPASIGLVGIFSVIFTAYFLDSRRQPGHVHTLLKCLLAASAMLPVLAIVAPYRQAVIISTLTGMIWAIGLLYSGVVASLNGSRAARYYTVAWGFFLAGSMLQGLRIAGIAPSNVLTEYAQFVGSALEGLLLSVALADRLREMKVRELAATAEAVEAREESLREKQIALDITQRYSEKLEAEVAERTRELVKTQQRLVASEKMAALGVFTAGMAHEINNPANFIAIGAQNTASQLGEMRHFINGLMSGEDDQQELRQLFDGHFARLHESNNIVQEGVSRIAQVVQRLRATLPEGEAGMRPEDLAALLESAWDLLRPTLRHSITLVSDWQSRPLVECAIAEIHEVFLALLTNAAQAIEDSLNVRAAGADGRIEVSGREEQGQVIMHIRDNGTGMAAAILSKIFDPFFTTRSVGKGAGLGLSMARDIVHKHKGTLTATSVEGQGSTFTLVFPLVQ